MNDQPPRNRERLEELLADRSLFGLEPQEEEELRELLSLFPDVDVHEWDRLVGSILLMSYLPNSSPGPESFEPTNTPIPPTFTQANSNRAIRSSWLPKREWIAWTIAASCLMIAFYSWNRQPTRPGLEGEGNDPKSIVANGPSDQKLTPTRTPSLAEQREELLASSQEVLHVPLAGGVNENDPNLWGDIVWSHTHQRGFLKLKGLPTNDPMKSQYQIWIVQSAAPLGQTINGGVFNVEQPVQELIIPIHADHFVQHPKVFVISIEPPGGSPDLTTGSYPLIAKLSDTQ